VGLSKTPIPSPIGEQGGKRALLVYRGLIRSLKRVPLKAKPNNEHRPILHPTLASGQDLSANFMRQPAILER